MALLINTKNPITIYGGIEVNTLYIRFDYYHLSSGHVINLISNVYVSKNAYISNNRYNEIAKENLSIVPLPEKLIYNRKVDGTDILKFIHKKCKEKLTTDIYDNVHTKDASTGEYLYDKNTGYPIYNKELIIPKFVNEEEISIIDLD